MIDNTWLWSGFNVHSAGTQLLFLAQILYFAQILRAGIFL
jgi:hypothetical protein